MTARSSSLAGVVNFLKPPGVSSRDAVDVVQAIVRPARAGHAGTLDPIARGVLVLCVGQATRLIEYVQRLPKRYRATFLLGRTSATDDVEGDVTELPNAPRPSHEEIAAAAAQWTGQVMQRPPAFSAIKVAGRRAYRLARAGRDVELAPRQVRIDQIDIVEYEYPTLVVDVRCGSGTYIRALGRDLAETLKTGAVMSDLVRSEVGHFHLDDAWPLANLRADNLSQWLRPMRDAVRALPSVEIGDSLHLAHLAHGRAIELPRVNPSAGDEMAAFDACGNLLAILQRHGDAQFRPKVNFHAPAGQ